MYQRPAAPQLIGGVLDDAFRLFKASFTQVVGLACIASAVFGAWRPFADMLDNLKIDQFPVEIPVVDVMSIKTVLLLMMAILASLYFCLGIAARMFAFASDRPISFAEAMRRATLRFPALLVCLLAPTFLIGITFFVLVFAMLSFVGGSIVGSIVVASIAVIVLLVLAFVMFIYLYFAFFLVVTANIGGVAALLRSFNLVRRNFWRTAVVLTIGSIVMSVVGMALGMVGVAVAFSVGDGGISNSVALYLMGVASGTITTPFWIAFSLALLRDLELRREGEDMASRIESVR